MYVIVGLGNPSPEYKNTRHNAGFDVIAALSGRFDIDTDYLKHKAICGRGMIEGNKVILAMPQTFMNLSGESIRQIVDYYKIDVTKELIVIYDDIALDLGQLRIRKAGSAGGHNGMKNIIQNLGTDQFIRVRVGVGGKPKGYDLKDYVLGHFTPSEREIMDESIIRAADGVRMILTDGVDAAMNCCNRKRETEDEGTEGSVS